MLEEVYKMSLPKVYFRVICDRCGREEGPMAPSMRTAEELAEELGFKWHKRGRKKTEIWCQRCSSRPLADPQGWLAWSMPIYME